MRAQFLQALARPLEDLRVANRKLDRFRRPVTLVREIEAKADMAERALETVSLGLAVAEIWARSNEEEDEP